LHPTVPRIPMTRTTRHHLHIPRLIQRPPPPPPPNTPPPHPHRSPHHPEKQHRAHRPPTNHAPPPIATTRAASARVICPHASALRRRPSVSADRTATVDTPESATLSTLAIVAVDANSTVRVTRECRSI